MNTLTRNVSTVKMPLSKWREFRRTGIGGSDAARIMGVGYGTKLDVYLDKVEGREIEETDQMIAGKVIEDSIARLYEMKTGIKPRRDNKIRVHPVYPFILGNLDRCVASGLLECKNTTSRRMDAVFPHPYPPEWDFQCHHYLMVTGKPWIDLAVLVDGHDLRIFRIEANEELQHNLLQAEVQFWENHVEKQIPPEPVNAADLAALYPRHTEGQTVEADVDLVEVIGHLKGLRSQRDMLDTEIEAAEIKIKNHIGGAEALKYHGAVLATWKNSKDSERFDTDRFRRENPELAAHYVKIIPGSRRFLVK